jgi:disulfide bond formation protein DsbB
MLPYAQTATEIFATIFLCIHGALLLVALHRIFTGRWVPDTMRIHLEKYGLWYASAFPVASFFLSLWYSEIVGLPVCALCWFGRTMMYPLAVILPIATIRKDTEVWRYVVPLSGIGALLTGYQHLMQVGFVQGSLCSVLKDAGDCSARYVFEYGYITMPLFGTTVFVLTALLVWVARSTDTARTSI